VVTQEFDPAAARMLRAFARRPGDSLDAGQVVESLVAEGDPIGTELSRNARRASEMLEQLRDNGLLEPIADPTAPSIARYRLSRLGRSRVERSDAKD
jgi:hypothetical protein